MPGCWCREHIVAINNVYCDCAYGATGMEPYCSTYSTKQRWWQSLFSIASDQNRKDKQ